MSPFHYDSMHFAGGRKCVVLAALLLAMSCGRRADPLPGFPRLVLWAWERPERLEFVDPRMAAVAYLARTVGWREGRITSRPRMQALVVAEGTRVMAVVRLESWTPPLPGVERVAAEILRDASNPAVRAVQIDFDARKSERTWYRDLLAVVHRRLDPSKPLSITALTSWCLGDPWVRSLPVSDAVPMLFRMGAGEPREVRGDFSTPVCRASVGISTDEIPYVLPHSRRIFIFDPHAWTPEAYRAALEFSRRFQ
jgi:hypothetical protein